MPAGFYLLMTWLDGIRLIHRKFQALLEMVRLQAIQLRQDRIFGEILLRKHTGFEAIIAEQAAVRDDWR